MDAATFLSGLGMVLRNPRAAVPQTVGPATWTHFMQGCLLDLAEAYDMHVCAEGLGKLPGRSLDPMRHMPAEFLFDLTFYRNWNTWSLPSVIIEHENQWTEQAFFQDFWKLLLGYAPLRVMFGYAGNLRGVDERVDALVKYDSDSRWVYPPGVEDLVLLRCPEPGGMPWPTWRVLHRPAGGTWNTTLAADELDRVRL